MSDTWKKMNRAIHSLTGSGSRQERLREAFLQHIMYIQESDFPDEYQNEFNELFAGLTNASEINEVEGMQENVITTIEAMDEAEITKWFDRIMFLYEMVTRLEGPSM